MSTDTDDPVFDEAYTEPPRDMISEEEAAGLSAWRLPLCGSSTLSFTYMVMDTERKRDPRDCMEMHDYYRFTLPRERIITAWNSAYLDTRGEKPAEKPTIKCYHLHIAKSTVELVKQRRLVPGGLWRDAGIGETPTADLELLSRNLSLSVIEFPDRYGKTHSPAPTYTVYAAEDDPVFFYADLELPKPANWTSLSAEERARLNLRVTKGLSLVIQIISEKFASVYEVPEGAPKFEDTLWVLHTPQNKKWSFHLHGEPFCPFTPAWRKMSHLAQFMGEVKRAFMYEIDQLDHKLAALATSEEIRAMPQDRDPYEGIVEYTIAVGTVGEKRLQKHLIDFGVYPKFQAMRMSHCCKPKSDAVLLQVVLSVPAVASQLGEAWAQHHYKSKSHVSVRASIMKCFETEQENRLRFVKLRPGVSLDFVSNRRKEVTRVNSSYASVRLSDMTSLPSSSSSSSSSFRTTKIIRVRTGLSTVSEDSSDSSSDGAQVSRKRARPSSFDEGSREGTDGDDEIEDSTDSEGASSPASTRDARLRQRLAPVYSPRLIESFLSLVLATPTHRYHQYGVVARQWKESRGKRKPARLDPPREPPLRPGNHVYLDGIQLVEDTSKFPPERTVRLGFKSGTLGCPFLGRAHDSNRMKAKLSASQGLTLSCFSEQCSSKELHFPLTALQQCTSMQTFLLAWQKGFGFLPDAESGETQHSTIAQLCEHYRSAVLSTVEYRDQIERFSARTSASTGARQEAALCFVHEPGWTGRHQSAHYRTTCSIFPRPPNATVAVVVLVRMANGSNGFIGRLLGIRDMWALPPAHSAPADGHSAAESVDALIEKSSIIPFARFDVLAQPLNPVHVARDASWFESPDDGFF